MKKLLFIFIIFISIFCITGCKNNDTSQTVVKNVTQKKENDSIIIDVRTKEEYDESHIVGAINIPYDEINENINLDKNKIIKVYCKSGKRSQIAYDTLINLGYKVVDLGAYDSINLEKE